MDILKLIEGPQFVLDSNTIEKTRELSAPELDYLKHDWGIKLTEYPIVQIEEVVFTTEAIASIAKIVNDASKER